MDGEVVENTPEWLERDDIFHHQGETAFVRTAVTVLVMVESPRILEGRWAHASEHGQLTVLALSSAFGGSDVIGVFADRGQAIDLESGESGHVGFAEAANRGKFAGGGSRFPAAKAV